MKSSDIARILAESEDKPIAILSGTEGERGRSVLYAGERSAVAIASILAEQRTGTGRWAKALIYSNPMADGTHAAFDLETGEFANWPLPVAPSH